MTPDFLILHSRRSSVVLECPPDEAPLWRYWGPRLPDTATPGTALRDSRPLPSFMLGALGWLLGSFNRYVVNYALAALRTSPHG